MERERREREREIERAREKEREREREKERESHTDSETDRERKGARRCEEIAPRFGLKETQPHTPSRQLPLKILDPSPHTLPSQPSTKNLAKPGTPHRKLTP